MDNDWLIGIISGCLIAALVANLGVIWTMVGLCKRILNVAEQSKSTLDNIDRRFQNEAIGHTKIVDWTHQNRRQSGRAGRPGAGHRT